MTFYTLLAVYLGMILALTFTGLSLVRLNRFSAFLNCECERVFEARIRGGRAAAFWPDVEKCYDNLKWYNPFDFNFQRMMVYDYTR